MTCKIRKTFTLLPLEKLAALEGHELKLRLLERMASSEAAQKRFWSKANVKSPNGCWEWKHTLFKKGYARVRMSSNGYYSTTFVGHRVAFYLEYGIYAWDLLVCHKCDNPKCINPKHLFIGTNRDNMQDMVNKGRQPRGSRRINHILIEDEVVEVRRRCLVEGEMRQSLADEFGVSYYTMVDVMLGRTWMHVPFPKGFEPYE